ncbi:GAF domain-containing sensor histidine kinase [Echinicola jeungdonensis]|uniref:histidine kinase n=1 Tax=Echinicola jeungdonensis TaxID=709343 RepID=A0ABV5J3K4_9BACT|nr:GAF domain-containing sensor histidine kinase [Echinicola jeungdonensis]MDN3668213.1 GAF domain-containing sensor histidine kinase [Echinicola jeungdonensis]
MKTISPNPGIIDTEQLVNIVQKLSLAHDIQGIMQVVRYYARRLTGADGATFVLREEDKCYYAEEDAISPLWKGERFPMSSCISGWVMENKKPVVIDDIYMDDRVPIDVYKSTFVISLTMVPIRSLDPIGAIGNYWATPHHPTEQEVRILQALADLTAVSIENIEVKNKLELKVKERTNELSDALEREIEIHKMKSTIVSMASHEFRTPLSTILSSAFLVQKYIEANQKGNGYKQLNRIKSSVKALIETLNDFLSLDKLEQRKVEPNIERIDLNSFLREISEGLDGMKKVGQTIQICLNGSPDLTVDKIILRNVLINLLSNAIKYSDRDIYLIANVTDSQITLIVKDQGIGIPQNQQEKIFSKFFRANNVNDIPGTGLGLNIVKHYINLLDGTIDFISQENKGTTFILQIPNNLEDRKSKGY